MNTLNSCFWLFICTLGHFNLMTFWRVHIPLAHAPIHINVYIHMHDCIHLLKLKAVNNPKRHIVWEQFIQNDPTNGHNNPRYEDSATIVSWQDMSEAHNPCNLCESWCIYFFVSNTPWHELDANRFWFWYCPFLVHICCLTMGFNLVQVGSVLNIALFMYCHI